MQYPRVLAIFFLVATAAQAQAQSSDWTGLYGGAQLDLAHVDLSTIGTGITTNEGNGLMVGATGGYRFDLGTLVLGASATLSLGAVDAPPVVGVVPQDPRLSSLATVGVEAGYDLGEFLVFGEIGYSWATLRDTAGSRRFDSGVQFGIGADYMLTDSVIVGGGISRTDFDGFAGSDVSVTSFGLRAAFRF